MYYFSLYPFTKFSWNLVRIDLKSNIFQLLNFVSDFKRQNLLLTKASKSRGYLSLVST